jgi:hypothetical protein
MKTQGCCRAHRAAALALTVTAVTMDAQSMCLAAPATEPESQRTALPLHLPGRRRFAMTFKKFRDESRREYGTEAEGGVSLDQMNAGSLQRIADATEMMAQNHIRLQSDLAQYKRWYNEEREQNRHLERRIRSLKGVITRLRKATL